MTPQIFRLNLICSGLLLLSLPALHAQAPPAASIVQTVAQAETDRKAGRFAEALARVQTPPAGASSADKKAFQLEAADVQDAWERSFGDSNPVQALIHCRAALALNQPLRPDRAADDFNQIGLACVGMRRFDEAVGAFRQAQALHHQTGNRAGEALALDNIGTTSKEAGRQDEAITAYRQAIAIYRQIGDKNSAGTVLSDLGDAYSAFGRYDKAIGPYRQSLVLSRQVNDKGAVASALGNLGNNYSALRRYKEALDCYQKLLPFETQFGNGDARADTLNRLGTTCRALGQFDRAAGFYRRALAVYRQEGEKDQQAEVLENMKLNAKTAEGRMPQKPRKDRTIP